MKYGYLNSSAHSQLTAEVKIYWESKFKKLVRIESPWTLVHTDYGDDDAGEKI